MFAVITNPELKRQLPPISWGQQQFVEASHVVVFAIRKGLGAAEVERFVDSVAETRGIQRESIDGYRKMMLGFVAKPPVDIDQWAARQVYIALGNFMTAAAALGVDTCPMEGIEPAKYDALLGLPAEGYSTLVAACAGYRAADDAYGRLPKVRYPEQQVIRHFA